MLNKDCLVSLISSGCKNCVINVDKSGLCKSQFPNIPGFSTKIDPD